MKTEIIEFAGDVPGNAIELRVLRFAGKDSDAPTAYLQSSLHGGELPGQAALHFLVPMLKKHLKKAAFSAISRLSHRQIRLARTSGRHISIWAVSSFLGG